MDARNLIYPMTAGDLVVSACVLAIRERGMGAETETTIWECMDTERCGPGWPEIEGSVPRDDARLSVVFRDRQTSEVIRLELKASTPLLFTRITR